MQLTPLLPVEQSKKESVIRDGAAPIPHTDAVRAARRLRPLRKAGKAGREIGILGLLPDWQLPALRTPAAAVSPSPFFFLPFLPSLAVLPVPGPPP